MDSKIGLRLRDKLLPMFVFPAVVGILTGILIFVFKLASSFVMHKSADVYAWVRQNPAYLARCMRYRSRLRVIAPLG